MTEQLIQIQETKSGKKSSKAAFNWQDPLSFDSLLTEDETIIQTQARQYCQKKLLLLKRHSRNGRKDGL